MKTLSKFSLVVAALATIGTSAAFADSQQNQQRLALQRAQNADRGQHSTVAVYAGQRGVGRSDARGMPQKTETRFEMRSNAHGETFGAYVSGK